MQCVLNSYKSDLISGKCEDKNVNNRGESDEINMKSINGLNCIFKLKPSPMFVLISCNYLDKPSPMFVLISYIN